MLVAYRLAGLSALEGQYADDNAQAQSGAEEPLPSATPSAHEDATARQKNDRGRPWRGSVVGMTPAKAGKAASRQIWGSWSDAGAAGEQPPIRAPSPSAFSGKA